MNTQTNPAGLQQLYNKFSLQIQHQTSDKLRRVICCHRKLITHTNSYRIHCLSHTILNIKIYIKWVQHSNSLSVRSKKATINACQRKTRNTITTETAGNYFPVSHGTRKPGSPTQPSHSLATVVVVKTHK